MHTYDVVSGHQQYLCHNSIHVYLHFAVIIQAAIYDLSARPKHKHSALKNNKSYLSGLMRARLSAPKQRNELFLKVAECETPL